MVDDPVHERERAHPRRLLAGIVDVAEVVFGAVALLLVGEGGAEVVLEVAAERRDPGESPAHPLLVPAELLKPADRLAHKRHVVAVEMRDGGVEVVGDERAGGTARVALVDVVSVAEHEVIDEQLRSSSKQLSERRCALVALEPVLLLDPDPGQLLPPPCQDRRPALCAPFPLGAAPAALQAIPHAFLSCNWSPCLLLTLTTALARPHHRNVTRWHEPGRDKGRDDDQGAGMAASRTPRGEIDRDT